MFYTSVPYLLAKGCFIHLYRTSLLKGVLYICTVPPCYRVFHISVPYLLAKECFIYLYRTSLLQGVSYMCTSMPSKMLKSTAWWWVSADITLTQHFYNGRKYCNGKCPLFSFSFFFKSVSGTVISVFNVQIRIFYHLFKKQFIKAKYFLKRKMIFFVSSRLSIKPRHLTFLETKMPHCDTYIYTYIYVFKIFLYIFF